MITNPNLAGTLEYMAPEIIEINYKKEKLEFDEKTVCYSIGIILFKTFVNWETKPGFENPVSKELITLRLKKLFGNV